MFEIENNCGNRVQTPWNPLKTWKLHIYLCNLSKGGGFENSHKDSQETKASQGTGTGIPEANNW